MNTDNNPLFLGKRSSLQIALVKRINILIQSRIRETENLIEKYGYFSSNKSKGLFDLKSNLIAISDLIKNQLETVEDIKKNLTNQITKKGKNKKNQT